MDNSPLRLLSAELLNMIGEMVFAQPYDIYIEFRPTVRKSKRSPVAIGGQGKHTFALTSVCHELRDEMRSLFYSCNSFVIELGRMSNDDALLGASDLHLEPLHAFLNLVPGRSVKSLTLTCGPIDAFGHKFPQRKNLFEILESGIRAAEKKVYGNSQVELSVKYGLPRRRMYHRMPYLGDALVRIDGSAPQRSLHENERALLEKQRVMLDLQPDGPLRRYVSTGLSALAIMLGMWRIWLDE
ncbi:uncharacterized protein LTR77_009381 [Saxophila tyrrhenica]|uniref:Uncharacterized protein n=1 Tax=Saxophila tyrrhenica TaxID=1690608 RepID=A0AAV9NZM7_9PEZI|nr:hypothetical protein LTR77_009381 [Saxophila tyrrhenica]